MGEADKASLISCRLPFQAQPIRNLFSSDSSGFAPCFFRANKPRKISQVLSKFQGNVRIIWNLRGPFRRSIEKRMHLGFRLVWQK